ncbi:MAG: rRNA maturation RNase YbeY [Chthoniobacter sp.]|nr:rRNA maturation RNase YbeY [Chthoniobacter sp.]
MKIHLENRQRAVRVNVPWLRRFAEVALVKCAGYSADERFALRAIPEVEVAIVSDRVIARVHRDFMGIPGATDVITFAHGEIVMSAPTAVSYAREFGHSTDEELALYIVHGLLHLNGYEDATTRAAARMRGVQGRLLRACLKAVPAA